MDFIYTIMLGIIEGFTEFLPISSTGHLLVASALMNFPPQDYRLAFDIFIQIGAVLAVIVYYSRDLLGQARRFPSDKGIQRLWFNLLIAFLPAAVVGLLAEKQLDRLMEQPPILPSVIGTTLIVGGIAFLILESRPRAETTHTLEQVTTGQAVMIGLVQAASIIPGVSRSGATIVGALLVGLDRVTATAFSFYLFIPTVGVATIYKFYSALRQDQLNITQMPLLLTGTAVAFVVSYGSIAWLLRYVAKHNFEIFGTYRILAGIVVILLILLTPFLSH